MTTPSDGAPFRVGRGPAVYWDHDKDRFVALGDDDYVDPGPQPAVDPATVLRYPNAHYLVRTGSWTLDLGPAGPVVTAPAPAPAPEAELFEAPPAPAPVEAPPEPTPVPAPAPAAPPIITPPPREAAPAPAPLPPPPSAVPSPAA
ncbi:MAG: hypothetical protein JWL83_34, partial [Actinomycetia bacterium]|nr:hypothetical protein [Actinomycetes bacterium]